MAIAVTGAHVSRALDFYNKTGKYFSISRTTAWDDEGNPPAPSPDEFKVDELIALKRVDVIHMVVEDNENGTISYRDTKWRIVTPDISTTTAATVVEGDTTVKLQSLAGIVAGNKLRIGGIYEGKILTINTTDNSVILDTAAPTEIANGSQALGGAYVEGAKYVYIECSLNYDQFPIETYRQVGVVTGVVPNTQDILRSAEYSDSGVNEFSTVGMLEILDNRSPTIREPDQKENISLIIQF